MGCCKLALLLAPRQQPSSPSPLPPFTFTQVLMCKMGTEAAQLAAPSSRAAQAWREARPRCSRGLQPLPAATLLGKAGSKMSSELQAA